MDVDQLWEVQAAQQAELGLDPRTMNALEKRANGSELVTLMHEESAEVGRIFNAHKRHILKQTPIDRANLAEAVVDVIKTAIATAQLGGVSASQFEEAFRTKTIVVSRKASMERFEVEGTRLACFDMDDVLCDIVTWADHLRDMQGTAPPNARTLQMMEAYKDEFYKSGGFRRFPAIPGASEGIAAIRALGYKIVVITARPQWQYKRLFGDTLGWLSEHGMDVDLLLFNKDKVEAIYEHLSPAWPVAFVDDHERNVRSLAAAGVPVLVFDRKHNQGIEFGAGVERVHSWAEIVEKFKEKATWLANI